MAGQPWSSKIITFAGRSCSDMEKAITQAPPRASLPSEALPQSLDTQAGRPAAAVGHRLVGGQDRPTSGAMGAPVDLRAGLSRKGNGVRNLFLDCAGDDRVTLAAWGVRSELP